MYKSFLFDYTLLNQRAQVVVCLGITKKKSPYNKMLKYYNENFIWLEEDSISYSETFCPMLFLKRMAFPVDMLDNCSHEELENSAEDYMSDLRCGDPENPEYFSLLNVTVRCCAVIFISLFSWVIHEINTIFKNHFKVLTNHFGIFIRRLPVKWINTDWLVQ